MQRSVEDPTILVATYEGEHNHGRHQAEISLVSSQSIEIPSVSVPVSSPTPNIISSGGPAATLDLVQSGFVDNAQKSSIHQFLVQHMATSLTRDPNFTAALATAISGKIIDKTSAAKW